MIGLLSPPLRRQIPGSGRTVSLALSPHERASGTPDVRVDGLNRQHPTRKRSGDSLFPPRPTRTIMLAPQPG
jgi:hypothetical protein